MTDEQYESIIKRLDAIENDIQHLKERAVSAYNHHNRLRTILKTEINNRISKIASVIRKRDYRHTCQIASLQDNTRKIREMIKNNANIISETIKDNDNTETIKNGDTR